MCTMLFKFLIEKLFGDKRYTWSSFLRKKKRMPMGRKEEPSAAIVDSQSVKTTRGRGLKGYDGGKKSKEGKGIFQ
ncbi:hypothetical protein DB41_FT00020 [Neochlamydia sp. TUME1]|nr:hypothetical protein DB41_FT00020 [Neochlamydia sp. TUME1]